VRPITLLAVLLSMAMTAAVHAQEAPAEESEPLSAGAQAVLETAPSLPPPAETAGLLREILTGDEFQEQAGSPEGQSLLSRFLDWLSSLLARVGLVTGSWQGTVIVLALVALMLYVVVRLLWQLASRRRTAMAERTAGGIQHMSAADLLAAADDAAAAGDHRGAIRLRFLALLRLLAEPGLALTTNHQLTRRVAKRYPSVGTQFRDLVLCYEDAWYGGLPCGSADYTRAGELAERVAARIAEEAGDERPDQ